MCGISGVISRTNIHLDSFVCMNQIIKHRGPNDEGFALFDDTSFEVLGSSDTPKESWNTILSYSPKKDIRVTTFEATVGLGHRRLSILDLSPNGHQPMCSNDERYWITYNGEIYNYIEIRETLIELGYQFNTATDTEVILVSYQHWGVECQNKFNGMWAFVIYDRYEKKIFMSRDRFGIKPLYYWFCSDGNFYFASEIKQFTVLPAWRAILNRERALDYLYFALTDHTEETLFQGVHVIPPSSYVYISTEKLLSSRSKVDIIKWYHIKSERSNLSFDEAKAEFLLKFSNAIKLHLRADVPVGCALSGGLDSSSIVSYINFLLKKENKSITQKTFSSCSDDPRFDEKFWMDEVIKETQVDAHFVYPNGEDIFSITEDLIWYMDEPYQSQSAFLGYYIFREARNNDVVVLLNGQGADEYLSGYESYKIIRQRGLVQKLHLKKLYKELVSTKKTIKVIIETIGTLIPASIKYNLSFYSRRNKNLNRILNQAFQKYKLHPYVKLQYNNKSHRNISIHQLFKDPLQKYLRWEDRNSMANSIEARVPFLDYRLVEFVHSLPLDYLDADNITKKILVESLIGILPEKVRNRKDKKGFITPEQKWFMNEFPDKFIKLFDENIIYANHFINKDNARKYLIDMQKGLIPFDYSYWRIISLCVWMKKYKIDV